MSYLKEDHGPYRRSPNLGAGWVPEGAAMPAPEYNPNVGVAMTEKTPSEIEFVIDSLRSLARRQYLIGERLDGRANDVIGIVPAGPRDSSLDKFDDPNPSLMVQLRRAVQEVEELTGWIDQQSRRFDAL